MPTVLDFITGQFKKSGIELTAEMKEALNNPELTKINLNDDLVKQHNDKLMTIEVAKQNPALKQHFRHETLAPLDTEINDKLITEYEIPDDAAAPIRAEKSTYEKYKLLVATVKQLQEKKATANVGDRKGLIEQIDKLNSDMLSLRQQAKIEKDNLVKENENNERDWNIRGSFSGYNYSDQYDKSDAIELGLINLNRQLMADGAKVILTPDKQLKLVQAADPSLDFTRENQKVSYKDYVDKLVADKKLIKTTDKPTNTPAPTPVIQPNGIGQQQQAYIPPRAAADIDSDLASALKASN